MKTILAIATILFVACGHREESDNIVTTKTIEVEGKAASFSLTVSNEIQKNCKAKNTAALTIDDHISEEALQILASENVRVTFFPIANQASQEMVNRALALGHGVGNHTYSHANLTLLSDTEIKAELNTADKVLGFKTVFFRPPWGAFNQHVLDVSGKIAIGWTDSADRVEYAAKSGVILLHEINRLENVIATHKQAGIKLVTLSECLGL